MNRLTRMLTMAGLGLVTGVTLGAGPAMAAASTDQGTAQSTTASRDWGNNDHVVGFFPSWFSCNRAGNFGDDRGWWDNYLCVETHSFDDRFALIVEDNDWGHGWNGHWPGHWVGQWWSGNNWHGNWHGGGGWWHHNSNNWHNWNHPHQWNNGGGDDTKIHNFANPFHS